MSQVNIYVGKQQNQLSSDVRDTLLRQARWLTGYTVAFSNKEDGYLRARQKTDADIRQRLQTWENIAQRSDLPQMRVLSQYLFDAQAVMGASPDHATVKKILETTADLLAQSASAGSILGFRGTKVVTPETAPDAEVSNYKHHGNVHIDVIKRNIAVGFQPVHKGCTENPSEMRVVQAAPRVEKYPTNSETLATGGGDRASLRGRLVNAVRDFIAAIEDRKDLVVRQVRQTMLVYGPESSNSHPKLAAVADPNRGVSITPYGAAMGLSAESEHKVGMKM